MTGKSLIFAAAFGSFLLLGGAFVFQALGYAPCQMCLWQRWPHAVAIGLGLVAIVVAGGGLRVIAALGALAAFVTGALGVYHTGVERDWWEGPSSCTGGGLSGLSGGDLLAVDSGPRLILCDEVSWEFLTLSMPSWNALWSFVLVAIWIAAWRKLA